MLLASVIVTLVTGQLSSFQLPASHHRRSITLEVDPFTSNVCPLLDAPDPSIPGSTIVGPGSYCVGNGCGNNATGAFGAAFCSGTECAQSATGFYAGAACVGEYCGILTTGYGAGSYCYGYGCASTADGAWAGSYCIGNACAQSCTGLNCGICCVGLNCSANVTSNCPLATNGGTPMSLGVFDQLFSDSCRNAIDTTSSTWTNFYSECSSGYNNTDVIQEFDTHCNITCTPELSMLLNYYSTQEARASYAQMYDAVSLRGTSMYPQPSSDDDMSAWEVFGIAVLGLVGAIFLAFAVVYAMKTHERKGTGYNYSESRGLLFSD